MKRDRDEYYYWAFFILFFCAISFACSALLVTLVDDIARRFFDYWIPSKVLWIGRISCTFLFLPYFLYHVLSGNRYAIAILAGKIKSIALRVWGKIPERTQDVIHKVWIVYCCLFGLQTLWCLAYLILIHDNDMTFFVFGLIMLTVLTWPFAIKMWLEERPTCPKEPKTNRDRRRRKKSSKQNESETQLSIFDEDN